MKRLRKMLRWTAIVLASLVAILLALNAFFVWSTGIELEKRLRSLRETGNPIQISDLSQRPAPPERNADTYLRRAADDLESVHKELAGMYPDSAQPPEVLSAAGRDRLDKLFSAYPRLMPLLEQAAACPDYDPGLDTTLPTTRFMESVFDHTGKHRQLTRVLRARTTLLVAHGQCDEAVANQLLLLRLTRLWRRDPLLVGNLTTAACEQTAMAGLNQVLQSGPVSRESRLALDAELALHDNMEAYVWAMRSERSYSLSSVRELPVYGYWLTRGFSNDLELRLIWLYDQYIARAVKPYSKLSDQDIGPPPFSAPNPYHVLETLLRPALSAVREPAERIKALTRCLRVLNVLQTRMEPGGDRVPQLDELGLPRDTTIDPYNDELLHIKKLPEGWLVYSVGRDLTDSGGTLTKLTDVGVGPVRSNKAD